MFARKEYARNYYKNKWKNDSLYRDKIIKNRKEWVKNNRTKICIKTKIYQENHPQYCKDCRKQISYNGGHMGGRCNTCSKIERFKDPRNHPNWQGGKSFEPYPLGWTNTFKEQIRYRDNYKCQMCGCPEVECKVKLHVHHIDYDKNNLNTKNLISLCKSCHSKTNIKRHYYRR